MPLTNETFFWVIGFTLAVLLALIVPMLIEIIRFRGDIKPICSFVNEVDGFFRQSGLKGLIKKLKVSTPKHHSLPPDKANERDNLIALAKIQSLSQTDADRLKQLLQEDANDELAKGVLSFLAFIVILYAIDALIKSFSKK
jgi:hypothetical protein